MKYLLGIATVAFGLATAGSIASAEIFDVRQVQYDNVQLSDSGADGHKKPCINFPFCATPR